MIVNEPLVYIILLNYNGYEDTIECVTSLESIDYINYRIIIVDNNSTDESERILREKLPQYIIIQAGSNLGFAGGNNVGIKYALENNADYILLLNNDTVVKENFLNILVEKSISDREIGIAIGKIYYFSDKSKLWFAGGEINKFKGNSYHFGYNEIDTGKYNIDRYISYATGCCMLISAKVIDEVGYLDEKYFLYYEDSDFSSNVINYGYQILYCPESIIYHKVSSSTGHMSNLSQYYLIRNRHIFIKRHIDGYKKIFAYTYFYAYVILGAFTKELNAKIIIKAINDFLKLKWGRQSIS